MRLAFAGTPAFAATCLQALLEAGHEVALVLTQPDRPAGRGMKLQASPVKQLAQAHGLPVSQPRSLRLDGRHPLDAQAAQQALQASAPQAMVVVAYGLILAPWALALPPLGCLNVHASLLPRWRGAAPIQRAIEAGDEATGVCIMRMEVGLDTGPVLLSQVEPIAPDDTAGSLQERLARQGASLLVRALDAAAHDGLHARAQPEQGITYAAKIDKAEAQIDWSQPAAHIERRLRAFDPFPGCHFAWRGEPLKLWRAALWSQPVPPGAGPGQLLVAGPQQWVVACGDGRALTLRTLQRPGGRRVEVASCMGTLASSAPRVGDTLA